jgi:hypothetical protein
MAKECAADFLFQVRAHVYLASRDSALIMFGVGVSALVQTCIFTRAQCEFTEVFWKFAPFEPSLMIFYERGQSRR